MLWKATFPTQVVCGASPKCAGRSPALQNSPALKENYTLSLPCCLPQSAASTKKAVN